MIHHGDCIQVMGEMEPESIDAIVTDPPYGLEFMGKAWDKLFDPREGGGFKTGGLGTNIAGRKAIGPTYVAGEAAQAFHARWAEAAYRVAKPSAYLLAFGGTRTVHRMTVALEDAGWIIRDMLVWAYASGFPKSKASLKPAWEPIVMARKPGPLRDLNVDLCRIGFVDDADRDSWRVVGKATSLVGSLAGRTQAWTAATTMGTSTTSETPDVPPAIANAESLPRRTEFEQKETNGRWPANVLLTDPIFDGGVEGVVGGGRSDPPGGPGRQESYPVGMFGTGNQQGPLYFDGGTYSRFFVCRRLIVQIASRSSPRTATTRRRGSRPTRP